MLWLDAFTRHLNGLTAVRTVAWIEAIKGVLALLLASGALALLHRDLHGLALSVIGHAHLNPATKYPGIFLELADHFGDARIRMLAAGAAGYAVLHLIEAIGLFKEKTWAEVLAAGGTSIYIPFELLELSRFPSLVVLCVLAINIAIVWIMVSALWSKRKARTEVTVVKAQAQAPRIL